VTPKKRPGSSKAPLPVDGGAAIARVLEKTNGDLSAKQAARDAKNAIRVSAGMTPVAFKPDLSFAIYFAKYIGQEIAAALAPYFPGVRSGETP
jgi:hypothetical protein